MQTYGNPNPTYQWWVGNSVVTNQSGRFIASHAAHTGMIAFAAGANTLFELSRFDSSVPMGNQGFVSLPHLAAIGIGFDEAGIWTGAGVVTIALLHLVVSMVYGAGGLLHAIYFPEDMQDSEVIQAKKFKLEWDNPDNQTFILGHHLIFMGVACIWFVEWARIHGIYDPAIGAIRQVNYNLDLTAVWNHQFDFLTIDSLEDVMGGHAFLAFFEIGGGAFHIATKQIGEYTKFKGAGLLSAEAILSFSLAGIGFMAIVVAFWCAQNTTVYPVEFYGEPLKQVFLIAPAWQDTFEYGENLAGFAQYSGRCYLANFHYIVGFFALQGHLWHALRSMGFNFKDIGAKLNFAS